MSRLKKKVKMETTRWYQLADMSYIKVPRDSCYYVKEGSKWITKMGQWMYIKDCHGKYQEVPVGTKKKTSSSYETSMRLS